LSLRLRGESLWTGGWKWTDLSHIASTIRRGSAPSSNRPRCSSADDPPYVPSQNPSELSPVREYVQAGEEVDVGQRSLHPQSLRQISGVVCEWIEPDYLAHPSPHLREVFVENLKFADLPAITDDYHHRVRPQIGRVLPM